MRTLFPLLLALFWAGTARPAIADRFREGDDAFRHRGVDARAREALATYRRTYAETPDDPDAGWRLAMAAEFVGFRLTKEPDLRKALFREGRDAGLSAVARRPECAPCQFWTAINQALYGDAVGAFKMLFTLSDVRAHLKATIRLDPGYAFGGAYRVLGLIEQKLPGILGGDNARARRYFEQAIAAAPDEPMNYLFLAKLLKEEMDQPEAALQIARRALTLPRPDPQRPESVEAADELVRVCAEWSRDRR